MKLNILAPSSYSTLETMANARFNMININNDEAIKQNVKYEKEAKQQDKKIE